MKFQIPKIEPPQGERVCLKDSKYILFEILENQTWKGCTIGGPTVLQNLTDSPDNQNVVLLVL